MTTDTPRWIANDLVYLNGGTAWGIDPKGRTFAIGATAEVEAAIRASNATNDLAERLYRAGVSVSVSLPSEG